MSFPPLFSSIQLAMRPAAIAALALSPGQVLTGRVTGRLANGATLLQAGSHQLALQLQSPPAVGTVLHLRVEGRGGDMRLVPVRDPNTGMTIPAPIKAGAGPQQVLPGNTQANAAPHTAATATPNLSAAAANDSAKAVLTQMVQSAMSRQASLAPVLQTVRSLGPVLGQMPEPVRRLATQLLAKSLKLDGGTVDATTLQKAVRQSGIFQESLLASGTRAGAAQGDTKAELQALSRALRNWVGAEPVSGVRARPPGAAPQATPLGPPPNGAVREGANLLLQRADSTLAQMPQGATARQASTALLLQTVQSLGPMIGQMPEPVRRVVAQLLERGMTADVPAATQRAQSSGSLLSNPAKATAPQDMEADLQMLSRTLRSWLAADSAPIAPVRPAPPSRGAPPRAPMRMAAPALAETVQESAKQLLEQTDDALARVRLLQNASVPEEAARHQANEWNLDLPIMLNGQPSVMPFQVQRDGGGEQEGDERGWRVRFAIDLGDRGEAGAQISLRGSRVSAMLWAAEAGTAALFEGGLGWLASALTETGLTPGTLVCRQGVPEAPARVPGGLLDSQS
jgi:hypothetical protein